MVPFSFAGHELAGAAAGRAVLARAAGVARRRPPFREGELVRATRGQMLPPYDSLATLTELTRARRGDPARRDLVPGRQLPRFGRRERLPASARGHAAGADRRAALDLDHRQSRCRSLPIIAAATWWTEARSTDWCCVMRPIPREPRARAFGPFPPQAARACARAPGRPTLLRRDAAKLILPAFGALTGGLDAAHPEIVRAVGGAAEALVPVEDRLLRFPLAACEVTFFAPRPEGDRMLKVDHYRASAGKPARNAASLGLSQRTMYGWFGFRVEEVLMIGLGRVEAAALDLGHDRAAERRGRRRAARYRRARPRPCAGDLREDRRAIAGAACRGPGG